MVYLWKALELSSMLQLNLDAIAFLAVHFGIVAFGSPVKNMTDINVMQPTAVKAGMKSAGPGSATLLPYDHAVRDRSAAPIATPRLTDSCCAMLASVVA